jgi:hypothetical protein
MPNPQREALQSMAEELADMMGAHHPGRPGYYALMHAVRAVKEAAQDVGEDLPARPKARLLPVAGTIGGDGKVTYCKGRDQAS